MTLCFLSKVTKRGAYYDYWWLGYNAVFVDPMRGAAGDGACSVRNESIAVCTVGGVSGFFGSV